MADVIHGTVAWFNSGKGFGFINGINGGPDRFVHYSAILMDGYRTLSQGDKVEFELGEKDGRTMAINVHVIEKAGLNGC